MNEKDREFLEQILGKPNGKSGWRVLFRSGIVLTLIRVSASREIPTLYRPQKRLARLAYKLFILSQRWSLPGPQAGRIIHFSEEGDCLLPLIEEEVGTEVSSLLIGNPVQSQRRFLGLIEIYRSSGPAVLKVGFSPDARRAIQGERDLISRNYDLFRGIPRLLQDLGGVGQKYEGFVLEWIDGREATEAEALELLGDWLGEERKALRDFPEWEEVSLQWKRAGFMRKEMEQAETIQLTSSLVHGDYAPWNLIVDGEGEMCALDWEAGRESGVPGLDWIHYFYQIDKHLKGLNPIESLVEIDKRMRRPDSQELLVRAGWEGGHLWLMMAYLAIDWLIDDQDRSGLLKEAKKIFLNSKAI